MSTLDALQLRKHDLRVELVKRVQVEGRTAESVQRVYHKLRQVQSEIVAAEVYFGVAHSLQR